MSLVAFFSNTFCLCRWRSASARSAANLACSALCASARLYDFFGFLRASSARLASSMRFELPRLYELLLHVSLRSARFELPQPYEVLLHVSLQPRFELPLPWPSSWRFASANRGFFDFTGRFRTFLFRLALCLRSSGLLNDVFLLLFRAWPYKRACSAFTSRFSSRLLQPYASSASFSLCL